MKSGALDDACAKFEESYRLDPALGTLLNLGICEEKRGHLASAWTQLHLFVDKAPASDDRTSLAWSKIAELEPQLPKLHIVLRDPLAADAHVTLDGVELRKPSFGAPMPVDPGAHVLELKLGSDELLQHEDFEIRAGQTLEITLTPGHDDRPAAGMSSGTAPKTGSVGPSPKPVEAPARATHVARHSRSESLRTAAYVAGAVGAAGFVASVVLGSLALAKKDDVHRHCPGGICDPAGLRAVDDGHALLAGADISLAVAIGSGLSCAAFFWQSAATAAQPSARTLHGAGNALVFTWAGHLP